MAREEVRKRREDKRRAREEQRQRKEAGDEPRVRFRRVYIPNQ